MIVEEQQLVRHKMWKGCGRVNRIRFDGTVDVWWASPNGRVGMKTALSADLIPPRKTDSVPSMDGARR